MGPIIIFDKSALEQLSVDESCWLDNFFLTNITPLLYVETLADLAKIPKSGRVARTAEQIVGELAIKAPSMNSFPNAYHLTLLGQNLMGASIDMSNRPLIRGGQTVRSPQGKLAVHFDPFPEYETMQRWQDGEFLAIENELAQQWRAELSNVDLRTAEWIRNLKPRGTHFRDLAEVKALVDRVVTSGDRHLLLAALDLWGVPNAAKNAILRRYDQASQPPLSVFAPYAAFVLRIDLVFHLAIDAGLISSDRPSNMIDVAYLYYLPFCMVFTSNDKLHARLSPLFMELGQTFVPGSELKACLAELDLYYSLLPEDMKATGIMAFAVYPPEHLESLLTRLWDRYLPKWRDDAKSRKENRDAGLLPDDTIVERISEQLEHSTPVDAEVSSDDAEHVIIRRRISTRKGKWRTVSEDVERSARAEQV